MTAGERSFFMPGEAGKPCLLKEAGIAPIRGRRSSLKEKHLIKVVPGGVTAPHILARRLGAKVLLESASFEDGRARYSLLMVDEAFRLVQRHEGIFFRRPEDKREIRYDIQGDILDALHAIADRYAQPHQDFPFPAGGMGYLSYEFARRCDSVRFSDRKDPLEMPEALFLFGHRFVIVDHRSGLLYLIGLNYREHLIDLEDAMDDLEEQLTLAMAGNDGNGVPQDNLADPGRLVSGRSEEEKAGYLSGVKRLRDEIIAGNLLQAVLSRRVIFESPMSAIEAYSRLRSGDPSPYHFYLDFGEYQLFGASPEPHISVKEGEAAMKPIAGTRRRGKERDEDLLLEAELREDPKEKAEHLMLVDLARNDLGRVCRPGSVEVPSYMAVERFARVMHLVSTVTGTLEGGRTGIDALRATFPAGTVSGAPKIRAMETLDSLEPHRRGFYAGIVGYLQPGGNLDSCITIRSAVKKEGQFILQAGAGIVYDSVPESEYEETEAKLSALARAVGLEETA
jgi:anthranilate synthase component I